MIEKITLAIVDESGNFVEIPKLTNTKIEMRIEESLAELYTAICIKNNNIEDEEIRLAEKFHFANSLQTYLKGTKKND